MQSDRMEVDSGETGVKRKGRGHSSKDGEDDAKAGGYTGLAAASATAEETASNAQRSIEGWIVIVTGIHEEASEDDLLDRFADYGEVKNLHLNLDRRTGYVKGYALVEYETKSEAEKAIREAPQDPFLEKTLSVDFAFVRPPVGAKPAAAQPERAARGRSASPNRKPLIARID